MGYRTVMSCPYVSGYDKAVEIFNKAIPIKGRSPELRPFIIKAGEFLVNNQDIIRASKTLP